MAFFTNAFEVPLSILIEHTQRKVRPVLEMVYMVYDIPFSISTFLPALLTLKVIQLENFLLQSPPLRPRVEGILISLGYQPWYLCNAVHPPRSPPQPNLFLHVKITEGMINVSIACAIYSRYPLQLFYTPATGIIYRVDPSYYNYTILFYRIAPSRDAYNFRQIFFCIQIDKNPAYANLSGCCPPQLN